MAMSVHQVLLETGFSPSQIAQMDSRAISAFDVVLTAAEQQRQAAEAAQQANREFYETKIIPGLTQWEQDQQRLENEMAAAQRERDYFKAAAVAAGIVPGEEPNRDASGRYVASAPGSTPGSPTFTVDEVRKGLGQELGTVTDVQWRYQSLFNKPLPIPPTELIRQAEAAKLDPLAFADRKFGFTQRENELKQQEQKRHDDEIAHAAVEAAKRSWMEKTGSNPDIRQPAGSAKYAEIKRGVVEGKLPDPLKMTDQQRRSATRQQIHRELAEREEAS